MIDRVLAGAGLCPYRPSAGTKTKPLPLATAQVSIQALRATNVQFYTLTQTPALLPGSTAGSRPQCETHLQTRLHRQAQIPVFLFRILLLERTMKVLKREAPRWTEPGASVPRR